MNSPKLVLAAMTTEEKKGVTSHCKAIVHSSGSDRRLQAFNSSYGMFRALAAALFLSSLLVFIELGYKSPVAYILLAFAILSFARMIRFADNYARELFSQFVALGKPDGTVQPTKLQCQE